MKLELQVVSLELAKRLKELGVKQESLYCWAFPLYSQRCRLHWHEKLTVREWGGATISAFTVAELGEMLPLLIDVDGTLTSWEGSKSGDGSWETWLEDGKGNMIASKFVCETEADARAKMLIYLLENKLVTL